MLGTFPYPYPSLFLRANTPSHSTKGKTLAATTAARRSRLAAVRHSQGLVSSSLRASQSGEFLPSLQSVRSTIRGLSPRVFVRCSQGSSPSPRSVCSPRRRRAASSSCSAAVILSPSSVAIHPPQRSKVGDHDRKYREA
ncbi:hypothetical protein AHAS_Ahas20G0114400 [Arachis hypogaea]